ncbi:hypothetical protein [Streptomyces sp. A1547]|uniref:hypothetical protein n=1 Tax=Streptomyces sp. A1547 TaxID=2563105 RepID=UPI00109E62F3|nr:hypothetical protein [Streptomyces sp. A1547]THA33741.1 hypothetical protein E6W17_31115 [Streptomyces sp. A1547]
MFSRVGRWWVDTPRAIRWVVYVCLPLGALAITLGVYGDGHGWWDDRSFLTNLASSFASLLFGVPLALVVLSHLSAMQDVVVERRVAQRQARRVAEDFRNIFLNLLPSSDSTELREAIDRLDDDLGQMRRLMVEAPGDIDRLRLARSRAVVDFGNVSPIDYEAWAAHINRQWTVLDEEIRPAVLSASLNWLSAPAALRISQAVELLQTEPALFTDSEVDRRIRRRTDLRTNGDDVGNRVKQAQEWVGALRRTIELIESELPVLATRSSFN